MTPLLTVCIAHVPVPERKRSLHQLLPQVERDPDVEVLVDDGEYPSLGEKRNAMREAARGEFVVMVDDDDLLHVRYTELVCAAIRNPVEPDYIGYFVHLRGASKLTIHDLTVGKWEDNELGWWRDIEQKNPIRRELAVQVPYPPMNAGEDREWAQAMRRSGLVKTQVFIPEVMYHYQYDPEQTIAQR